EGQMKKIFATPAMRGLLQGSLLAAGVLSAGCGGGQEDSSGGTTTTTKPTFDYPMDDELRLNQLQAKRTHNTYHVEDPNTLVTELKYTHAPLDVQLSEQGVRQIELDVRYNKFEKHFSVFHESFDKGTTCPTLIECLDLVKTWSDKFPAHHPVF